MPGPGKNVSSEQIKIMTKHITKILKQQSEKKYQRYS
jgi:hypothetical protein